jgi:hypothetical protein
VADCPSLDVELVPDVGLEAVEPNGGGPDQVEQRVQQCHAGYPDPAEETEPGPIFEALRGEAAILPPTRTPDRIPTINMCDIDGYI